MSRTWFSKGLRGMIARRIQADLFHQGFAVGSIDQFVDGDFGGNTESSLRKLQAARSLQETGAVDDATWQQLTVDPIPTLFERCLGLSADFEGHGFGLIQGNFDGAGLTWGIIGFTLSNGEIQDLLAQVEQEVPGTLDRVMGTLANQWRAIVSSPRNAQIAWADALSTGPNRQGLPLEWKTAFARLGEEPMVKRLQMHKAYDDYFVPAATTAKRVKITSELGIALCFDMHVQNGTSRVKAVAELETVPPKSPELHQREALANAVADKCAATWREDVRSRKLAIARGVGTVHGRAYKLANWGIAEFPAQ
jgi:hypothetical protein